LGFIAAILWGIYCNISKRYGDGQNGVPLFFGGVALALWLKFLIGDQILIFPDTPRPYIEMVVAGVIIGSSYSFWEYGIQHGNMIVLATLSYFTPLLSILFSSIWLEVTPTMNFWLGAIIVTLGSFLAYLSTIKYCVIKEPAKIKLKWLFYMQYSAKLKATVHLFPLILKN